MSRKITIVFFTLAFIMMLGAVSFAAVPAQVTGVKQVDGDHESATVKWNELSDADGYEIYDSGSKDGTYSYLEECSDNESYIYDWKSGSTHYVKVRAYRYNDDYAMEYGSFSAPVKVVIAPDGHVENIKQSNTTRSSATLSWDSCKGASGYVVKYSSKEKYTAKNTISLSNLEKDIDVTIIPYIQGENIKVYGEETSTDVVIKPKKVINLKQKDAYYDVAEVEYSMPCDYTQVYYASSKNGKYEKLYQEGAPGGYVELEKLKSGKHYYIKVRNGKENYYTDQIIYGDFSEPFEIVTELTGKVKNIKQKKDKITTSSTVITWTPVSGADYYIVKYGKKKAKVTKASAKVFFTKKNKSRKVTITPYIASSTYKLEGDEQSKYVYPRPKKAVKPKCSYYTIANEYADMTWKTDYYESGSQYKVYNNAGKCIKKGVAKNCGGNLTLYNIGISQFYSFKVRNYKVIGGNRVYGAWSDKTYFCGGPKVKGTRTSHAIKAKWSKVSGATNYTVYISKAYSGGFKKVATTKKTKYKITKFGKKKLNKNQGYYVKVIANKKVGKKTYKTTCAEPEWFY